MFVFIICILHCKVFRYTPPKYYYQMYFIPIRKTLCCVYDGSNFRVLHQKQVFSLPSYMKQSGQRIDRALLGKWILQIKIQIHKFAIFLSHIIGTSNYKESKIVLLSFYFSIHITFMQIQFMTTSPQTRITDQLAPLFVHHIQ